MTLLLLFSLLIQQSDHQTIRELVYQAEVYNQHEQSLEALKLMLMVAEPQERTHLVKAIALLNEGRNARAHESVMPRVAEPQGVIFNRGSIFLMAEGHWLELGDWIGDYYLDNVLQDRIHLRTRDGLLKEVMLVDPLPEELYQICIFRRAPAKELLAFLARQAQLNAFLPSNIATLITGELPLSDWLSILDIVSRESNLDWSRRRDNVVFVPYQEDLGLTDRFKTFTQSGVNLEFFLRQLAKTFDLELIVDPRLKKINVDIYADEQPWDETLDCLAMMNDFSWDLSKESGERNKLVIMKNAIPSEIEDEDTEQ